MSIPKGEYELVKVCLDNKLMEKVKAKAEEWDLAIQDAILKILKETLK
jgi:hypothetical protein